MAKKVTFRELLKKEQIFAPCVYDCITARAADLCGFKTLMLSGGAVAYSMDGLPDMAFATIDEIVWVTERITNVNLWPLIVDADDGYGESPVVVYRNMARLAKAGAMGITVDDSTGIRGYERKFDTRSAAGDKVIEKNLWLTKIKASLAACEGSDCVVIARIHVPMNTKEGFEEAIDRALRAKDLGAEMIMLGGTTNMDIGRRVAKNVPGWKMWPDIFSVDGVPNADLQEIDRLGYRYVTMHLFEKAALYGMLKFGKENFKNKNAVFSQAHGIDGYVSSRAQAQLLCDHEGWAKLEADFKNL